ncbi:MAG: hypothetical protein J6S67_25220 [Methanobrevibacter sp.]|nr:hypothetical protein [Methanobrevibacter sp.]
MSNALKLGNNQNLASLLELYRLSLMYQINCHQIGEIVSFNPSTQTAEVQIKMSKIEDDEIKEYPILIDCPCVILSGGKGSLTFPIEAGDSCLVLFNDRDIDNWYSGGQKMPPRTPRMHNFADAIALVSVRNKQNKISNYLSTGTELKYGNSTIKLEDGKVTVTNGSSTVLIDNTGVNVTGANINLTGNVVVSGSFVVNGKDIGPGHTHTTTTSGYPTSGVN